MNLENKPGGKPNDCDRGKHDLRIMDISTGELICLNCGSLKFNIKNINDPKKVKKLRNYHFGLITDSDDPEPKNTHIKKEPKKIAKPVYKSKKCRVCGEKKDLSEFYTTGYGDGYENQCKKCRRKQVWEREKKLKGRK